MTKRKWVEIELRKELKAIEKSLEKLNLNKEDRKELQSLALRCIKDLVSLNRLNIVGNEMSNNTNKEASLNEIGIVFGISRERVRQIEAISMKKLKSPKVARKLRPFIADIVNRPTGSTPW